MQKDTLILRRTGDVRPKPNPARRPQAVAVANKDLYRVTIGLTARAYDRLETLRVERDEVSIADVARSACRLADRIDRARKAGKVIMLMNDAGDTITLDAFLAQPASGAGKVEAPTSGNQIRRLTFGLTPEGAKKFEALRAERDETLADFVRNALRLYDRLHQAEQQSLVTVLVDPRRRGQMHEAAWILA